MLITMTCGKTMEINECNEVDMRETSNSKWMLYTITDDEIRNNYSIGVLDNIHEAAAALESLRESINDDRDWNFNQYIKQKEASL